MKIEIRTGGSVHRAGAASVRRLAIPGPAAEPAASSMASTEKLLGGKAKDKSSLNTIHVSQEKTHSRPFKDAKLTGHVDVIS